MRGRSKITQPTWVFIRIVQQLVDDVYRIHSTSSSWYIVKRNQHYPVFNRQSQDISSIILLYKILHSNNKFQMQSEGTSYNPSHSPLHTQRPSFYSPPPEPRDPQRQVLTASSMTNIHYSEFDRIGSSRNSPPRANRSGQLRSSSGCCNNGSSYTSRFVEYRSNTLLLVLEMRIFSLVNIG